MGRTPNQLDITFVTPDGVPEFDRSTLVGLEMIGRYMRCSPQSIRMWYRKHGFPAAKLPAGRWMSSTALIDLWILARNEEQKKHPRLKRKVKV